MLKQGWRLELTCYKCGGEVAAAENSEHHVCKECGESADEKYVCEFGHLHDYSKLELPPEDEYLGPFKGLDDLYEKLDEAETRTANGEKSDDFNAVADGMREKLIRKLSGGK